MNNPKQMRQQTFNNLAMEPPTINTVSEKLIRKICTIIMPIFSNENVSNGSIARRVRKQ